MWCESNVWVKDLEILTANHMVVFIPSITIVQYCCILVYIVTARGLNAV